MVSIAKKNYVTEGINHYLEGFVCEAYACESAKETNVHKSMEL